jgi:AraC-like DNA-binding protein
MRILALLPDTARNTVERAIGPGNVLVQERSVTAVVQAVRTREYGVLVLDPGTLGDEEFARLLPALKQTTVPVILFTALTSAGARRIVQAAEQGAHELVLRDAEDAVTLLAHKFNSLVVRSAPALLLNLVAKRFHRFPDALRTASVALFGSGPLPRWVDGLAHASGFARRTVDRWMERAGIDGAATLLDAARLARVWEPAVEEQLSIAAIAERCGYARPRLLVAHARRIVGVAPAEFREALTREQFAKRLARKLLVR